MRDSFKPTAWAAALLCTPPTRIVQCLGLASLALSPSAWAADKYISDASETINTTQTFDAVVVANTDDAASLTIQGAGTVVSGTTLVVGSDKSFNINGTNTNDGQLTVTGGASLSINGDATLSYAAGTLGTISVDTGSQLGVTGRLNVGRANTGTLNSAGVLTSDNAMIGDLAGSGGSKVTLLSGGSWTNTNALTVGGAAGGTLQLDSGSAFTQTAGALVLGNSAGVTGTLSVTSAARTTQALQTAELRIGNLGTGTFNAQTTTVASSYVFLGHDAASSAGNTATLNNSAWNIASNLDVGYGGQGSVTLQNSAVAATGNVVLGNANTGQGSISLQTGSTLSGAQVLIGSMGQGTVTADGVGTRITSSGVVIGNTAASTGSTATFTNSAQLDAGTGVVYVGNAGQGTLTLASGASVTAASMYVGWDNGGNGTLQLSAGAAPLNVGEILFNNGTGAVRFNHGQSNYTYSGRLSGSGTVHVGSGTTLFTGNSDYTGATTVASGATLQIGNGGTGGQLRSDVSLAGTLVLLRSDPQTYSAALSGAGTLRKLGGNTLTISGNSFSFTGPTLLEAGKLIVAPVAAGPGYLGGPVTLSTGTELAGHGYVGAVQGSGTVAPGHSIGTLRVTGNADLTASTLDAEIDAATSTSDLLDVTGSASLAGGTLRISNLAGTPTAGQTYTVLRAGSINGQFGTVTFAQTYPGLNASVQYTASAVNVVFASSIPAGSSTHAIPVLSPLGLVGLAFLMGGAAFWTRRKPIG
ncbi:IPTL-CTERM sorting domain-containing protein [Acidovorax sp. 106]|uniref:beta strand repeat-containing protein n=1 Tax=Acidovorax sp. 106 TaxID=2135637 RepID=UPI000EACAED4|nr:IPTL-CTERM sorting domain-containing protein [Acidovorax sp. 106]RLJ37444.1 putative secreted protein (IPTL-CTERM system target) [Acidovorax sp. 106]